MKPWTERKHITRALRHEGIRIGERQLPSGESMRGLYATRDFKPGDFVAAYLGKTIDRTALFALHATDRARFEFINEYAALLPSTNAHLYPEKLDAIGAHLINHSCRPNARWGRVEYSALLVRATRPIAAGEEITIHYGWLGLKAAIDKSQHPCRCDAPYCAGTIELMVEWIENPDNTAGPRISHEEIRNRMLADLVNDTDEHEALLIRYADEALNSVSGIVEAAPFDAPAFYDKLCRGAEAAMAEARTREGISGRRLRQLTDRYTRQTR